jgi:hypothetical protein
VSCRPPAAALAAIALSGVAASATPPATPGPGGDAVETVVDPQVLFADLGGSFEDGPWSASVLTLDARALRRAFVPLVPADQDDLVARVVDAWTLRLTRPDDARQVRRVTCLHLAGPDDGPPVLDLLDRFADRRVDPVRRLARTGAVRVDEPGAGPIAGLAADATTRRRIAHAPVVADAPGGPAEMTLAAAVRGRTAVHVLATGDPVDDAALARAIALVLERSETDAARVPAAALGANDPLAAVLDLVEAFLADGAWVAGAEAIDRRDATRLVGSDVRGRLALETAWVGGRTGHHRGRDGTGRSVTVTVIRLTEPATANALTGPLAKGSQVIFRRFAARPGATLSFDPSQRRHLDDGTDVRVSTARVERPDRDATRVTLTVARRGRHVVHVVDEGGAVPEPEAMLRRLLDALDAP